MEFRERLKDLLDSGYSAMVESKDWDESLEDMADKVELLMLEVISEESQDLIFGLKKTISDADEEMRKALRKLKERHGAK